MADGNEVWGKVLKAAIKIPAVNVDREVFLKKELRRYFDDDTLQKAIDGNPTLYLTKSQAAKIANGCINYHLTLVTSASALAGIPGGWWMAGTVPADLTQFYGHILALAQKLMYIYGCPSISNGKGEYDDETSNILTIFVGVMMGEQMAVKTLGKLLEELSKQVAKKLPKQALTKYAIYNIVKKVAKWIGVKITKDSFAKGAGKLLPIIGAPISGAMTYYTFKPMANRLKRHLENCIYSD
ncbi:MAG: hypothetical protein E7092_06175 [Bacteroidales bacterium]|nr:hypothetical protein [Bacteroidales bacterium]